MNDEPSIVESVIHRRRSSLAIDADTVVDRSTIERLTRAGQAAPNHRRTRPLRIAVVEGDGRRRLGNAIAEAMAQRGDEPAKVEKSRTKYLRAPIVLVVASARGDSDLETEENRYAVAASIENMLILAESLGMAALWGSPPHGSQTAITSVSGFETTDHVIGLVYLGWPSAEPPMSERPDPIVRWID